MTVFLKRSDRALSIILFFMSVVLGAASAVAEPIYTGNSPVDQLISGTVTDETGAVLPGANVVLKGTTKGTTTGANGTFQIEVPGQESTLIVSFLGYITQEVAVGNRTDLKITLQADRKALDEVVVVGYGTQSKRNVTGAIASVDMKALENLPNTNVGQALRGRVAGVQFTDNGRPGQGGSILVRGARSITASNNPLIILDGIFFEGSINDINPGDIASMEVLKDASATAIYGARAANGVILITSKKGTTEKPTIRFGVLYGASNWSNRPKMLSPERYIQQRLDWRAQANLPSDPAKIADYLDATEAKNYLAGNTVDPWDLVSQQSSIQNYDLSISGRSGRTNYFISSNFNKDKGLIFNDNSTRTSVRMNIENQVVDWLKIGVNAQYSERDLSGVEANMASAFWTSPFVSPWLDEAKTDPNPFPTEDLLGGSALFGAITNQNQEVQRNLFANFFGIVDVPFIKGLSYRINYSPNYRWYNVNNFSPIYQRNGLNNLGSASRRIDFNKNWVLENILTYTRQLTENHAFDLTLLYGRNQANSESILASGVDFTGVSDVNGWNNLSLARIQTTTYPSGVLGASNVDAISSMARLNYRFMNRYLLTLTARRDANSVFGANKKFGTFPSVALAWVVSDEAFMEKVPLVNSLKLRASYGSVGNQAISAYQSLVRQNQVQYVFGDGGATTVGILPANMANPNLSWETTTTTNIGLDFELLKGRLGGTVEWYNLATKDLLLNRQLPTPTGFSNVLTNVGATNNRGVEIALNSVNLTRDKFEWSSSLTFSANKNKIVHIYRSDVNGDGVEDDDIGNRWFIGSPINVIYDYTFDGIYQQNDQIPVGQKAGFVKVKDLNGDGKIDADDRSVIGNRDAIYRWGLANNFKYGRLNLMVMLNSLMGWQAVNNVTANSNSVSGAGDGNFPDRAVNRPDLGWWTPENKSNTRASLVYTNPLATAADLIQSRDFVRIQEVALSYDLPVDLLSRLKMSSLRVFLSGRNLHTFTKWTGMDPESGYATRGTSFPTPRTLSAGLNVSF
ncbi:TonB-linked SusC/RagA family outer membrane protein [Larkinella arboricola]|uniref:TonB-linked SusC/RagA family outer membrane protein n=1 Tax=Larkinella arboricola TaxID=643671 RepID=A0A327WR87_LARAB|nr:TonB-dependent receptor [Larkinella arboricola]RAJ94456.1 TonB-linked SusC/RagA family outer membrane protein [Larkinella arboricola]